MTEQKKKKKKIRLSRIDIWLDKKNVNFSIKNPLTNFHKIFFIMVIKKK